MTYICGYHKSQDVQVQKVDQKLKVSIFQKLFSLVPKTELTNLS